MPGPRPTPDSPITYKRLHHLNRVAALLHGVQFVFMTIASVAVPKFRDFKLPLTWSKLEEDPVTERLFAVTVNIGSIHIAPFVCTFFFLSATFQGAVTLNAFRERYEAGLKLGINRFRWYEYALSSSFMIVPIVMFVGVYDFALVICIFFLNLVMILLGLLMEEGNVDRDQVTWKPFIVGCVAALPVWGVAFTSLGLADAPPDFVYAIYATYFFLFNLFPVNMVLSYLRVGKWADSLYGEVTYITLSFVAKSTLAWLVFGGLNQPNNFN